MKALDEYILMVLFVLLLKRVHFLVNETYICKGVTTQMKALDEYFLMVVFTLLLNRVQAVFAIFVFNLDREALIYCEDPGDDMYTG